jgi:hypothetical protein
MRADKGHFFGKEFEELETLEIITDFGDSKDGRICFQIDRALKSFFAAFSVLRMIDQKFRGPTLGSVYGRFSASNSPIKPKSVLSLTSDKTNDFLVPVDRASLARHILGD